MLGSEGPANSKGGLLVILGIARTLRLGGREPIPKHSTVASSSTAMSSTLQDGSNLARRLEPGIALSSIYEKSGSRVITGANASAPAI